MKSIQTQSQSQAGELDKIIQSIIGIAKGDYESHLPVSEENNEYDALALGINMMMDDIRENINQRIASEQRLTEQNEELKRLNAELDRFVYSTSHELRSPLSSLLGLINISQKQCTDERMMMNLAMMQKCVNNLDGLLKNIFSYSRNSRFEIAPEKIDLQNEVRESIDALKFMEGADHITFKVSGDDNADFCTDKMRVRIILNNLLSNAIKYRHTGKEKNYVNVSTKVSPTEAKITIRDNGIGIPAESHEKLFQMFYRATETRPGTGIGLYILKEAVTRLEGSVKFRSNTQTGTTFTVTLPNKTVLQ